VALAVTLAANAQTEAPQDKRVFRTGTDAVLVDVSVLREGKPVRGLTATDFELRDNQVEQQIDLVSADEVPVDVSLLVDVSASVAGQPQTKFVDGVHQIAALLRPTDAIQIVLAGAHLRRVRLEDLNRTVAAAADRRLGDGGTALYDGLTALLMQRSRPGRRHVILVMSDAVDTSSVVSESALRATITRSDATVYMVGLFDPSRARAWGFVYLALDDFPTTFDRVVSDVVEASGGRFFPYSVEQPFVPTCATVLDDVRSRYLLSYRPRGVVATGWHELNVQVPSGRFDVRARRGYLR
jgi:VWFA-related protein